MALYTLAGTTVSIGTSVEIDFSTNAAALAAFAGDTYIEIGETETLSDFGDTATPVTFLGLGDARDRVYKGTSAGGSATITCGDEAADPGQAAVKAASVATNQAEYNIKFEWRNGDVSYIRGPVMGWERINGNGPNNVAKRRFSIANVYGEYLDIA